MNNLMFTVPKSEHPESHVQVFIRRARRAAESFGQNVMTLRLRDFAFELAVEETLNSVHCDTRVAREVELAKALNATDTPVTILNCCLPTSLQQRVNNYARERHVEPVLLYRAALYNATIDSDRLHLMELNRW